MKTVGFEAGTLQSGPMEEEEEEYEVEKKKTGTVWGQGTWVKSRPLVTCQGTAIPSPVSTDASVALSTPSERGCMTQAHTPSSVVTLIQGLCPFH